MTREPLLRNFRPKMTVPSTRTYFVDIVKLQQCLLEESITGTE